MAVDRRIPDASLENRVDAAVDRRHLRRAVLVAVGVSEPAVDDDPRAGRPGDLAVVLVVVGVVAVGREVVVRESGQRRRDQLAQEVLRDRVDAVGRDVVAGVELRTPAIAMSPGQFWNANGRRPVPLAAPVRGS